MRSRLGIVVRLFKEITIHGGIKFVMEGIITSIALLSNVVPKKYTIDCPWFKLGSFPRGKVDIHYTPKYARRKGIRRGNKGKSMKGGKRSLEIEDFNRETVHEIGGSSKSLGPKTDRHTSLKHESS